MAKKKKVLLMSPNLKGIKDGVNRVLPGLGMGYLAAVLESRGYEVFIYDAALEGYENKKLLDDDRTILIGPDDKDIEKYIKDINPDLIGISVLFSNLSEHAHTLSKIIKNINPEIKVVVGGNHVTNVISDYVYALKNPKSNIKPVIEYLEDKNIDYAMHGECDIEFSNFVDAIFNNKNVENIRGLIYRKNDKIIINPKPDHVDVNKIPFPARHLMNMEKYFKIGLFHSSKSVSNRVLNIMSSRGCPEKCNFCTTPTMWGSKVRWRNPEHIFKEIKECVEKYKIEEIQFEDDTLTANIKNLNKLCDLIEPLGLPWCTPNGIKVNYHLNKQPEMFAKMKKAGCYQITFGCESGVQRVLDDIINKQLNLKDVKPAIENAKKAGLFVHSFWIVGFPGEKRAEMEQTVSFAEQSGADTFSISILTPLPGSPIFRHIMANNLWWDNSKGINEMLYRNSLVRVDGFNSSTEFEEWVNEKNIYLNSLLEKNDPERAKARINMIHNVEQANLKVKQT